MPILYKVLVDRRVVRQTYEPVRQSELTEYFRMFDFVGTDVVAENGTTDGHYEYSFRTKRKPKNNTDASVLNEAS